MKLTPKAKPVKIRIMSGGKEHSSVESLKQHFDIDDVKMLLDGRLARWLKQQGRNDLAASVSEFSREKLDTKEGCVQFIKIFFGEDLFDKECSTLSELVSYWLQYKKEYTTVWTTILCNLLKFDKNEAITIYNNLEKRSILSKERWFPIFSYLQKSNGNDAELLYILGCLQYDDVNGDKRMGRSYIEKAAELGNKFAKDFVAKNAPERFPDISEKDKQIILDNIDDLLIKRVANLSYLSSRFNGSNIEILFNFAELCAEIKRSSISFFSIPKYMRKRWYLFYKEAVFINYFLGNRNKNNLNDLKEIAPLYPPANWLVENYGCDRTFIGRISSLNFNRATVTDVMRFVFAHIFEY